MKKSYSLFFTNFTETDIIGVVLVFTNITEADVIGGVLVLTNITDTDIIGGVLVNETDLQNTPMR